MISEICDMSIIFYIYFSTLATSMATSKSFIKANSQSEIPQVNKKLDRLNSLRGSVLSEPLIEDTFGPLSNVRYSMLKRMSHVFVTYEIVCEQLIFIAMY